MAKVYDGFSRVPNPGGFAEQQQQANAGQRRTPSRVYLLDVQPLCYRQGKPNTGEFLWWIEPFLTKIVKDEPVVAVFDGRSGNAFRRKLLPSYKAGRPEHKPEFKGGLETVFSAIHTFFSECSIPVVRIDDAEADDVVATLAEKTVNRDLLAVIASPDKDFKQLLSDRVQLLVPLHDLRRWSFFTSHDYVSQRRMDPASELGLRCLLGDAVDGVPGIPGLGQKTAMKLMRKFGSMERLMSSAAVRCVGRPYVQQALRDHACLLDTNLRVLSLRRDLEVTFPEKACTFTRDRSNDRAALCRLRHQLSRISVTRKGKNEGIPSR